VWWNQWSNEERRKARKREEWLEKGVVSVDIGSTADEN
jgi:hypothetical protein